MSTLIHARQVKRCFYSSSSGHVYRDTNHGQSSVVNFYKFKDAAGNIIVNFSSNEQGWKQGDTVTIKATVKKHEEREGIKQTKLTRAEEYSAVAEAEKKLAQKNAAWLKKNPVAYA